MNYVQMIMDRYGCRNHDRGRGVHHRHLAGQPMTREEALAMRAQDGRCMIAAVAWRRGAVRIDHDTDIDRVARVIGIDLNEASLLAYPSASRRSPEKLSAGSEYRRAAADICHRQTTTLKL